MERLTWYATAVNLPRHANWERLTPIASAQVDAIITYADVEKS